MYKPSHLKPVRKLLALTLLWSVAYPGLVHAWKNIGPGIDYLDVNYSYLTPWSHIHAFKIDPQQYRFQLALANSLDQRNASVDSLARDTSAAIAFNGGFFDKQYRPLGLRISNGQRINPIKQVSWWGIFYLKHQRAFIASPREYIPSRQLDFALQSGPRLIINGRIPPLKPGRAQRTALGITPQGQVIVVVTDNVALSTSELATLMQSPPLSCRNALNLDGGSSTQLWVNLPDFKLNVHGFSNVSDVVLLVPKPR
ncbi:MAG: phosphodiester glycosidase family protein [Legionellaceae bacterium]|nr:phosphodiester glycosidase family protein [Legionellaceae bacterium]